MISFSDVSNLKSKKNILKNQNAFRRNRSTTSRIVTLLWITDGVCAKKQKAILVVDLSEEFDYIHKEKVEHYYHSVFTKNLLQL